MLPFQVWSRYEEDPAQRRTPYKIKQLFTYIFSNQSFDVRRFVQSHGKRLISLEFVLYLVKLLLYLGNMVAFWL